jgi:hypothetical protein
MIQKHAESLRILMFWILASEIQKETLFYLEILQFPFSNWEDSLTIRKSPLLWIHYISNFLFLHRPSKYGRRILSELAVTGRRLCVYCIVLYMLILVHMIFIILGINVKCTNPLSNSTYLTISCDIFPSIFKTNVNHSSYQSILLKAKFIHLAV